jgi:hypothetical protein
VSVVEWPADQIVAAPPVLAPGQQPQWQHPQRRQQQRQREQDTEHWGLPQRAPGPAYALLPDDGDAPSGSGPLFGSALGHTHSFTNMLGGPHSSGAVFVSPREVGAAAEVYLPRLGVAVRRGSWQEPSGRVPPALGALGIGPGSPVVIRVRSRL